MVNNGFIFQMLACHRPSLMHVVQALENNLEGLQRRAHINPRLQWAIIWMASIAEK